MSLIFFSNFHHSLLNLSCLMLKVMHKKVSHAQTAFLQTKLICFSNGVYCYVPKYSRLWSYVFHTKIMKKKIFKIRRRPASLPKFRFKHRIRSCEVHIKSLKFSEECKTKFLWQITEMPFLYNFSKKWHCSPRVNHT